ncbi:hypothetical protein GCM10007103_06000 [Salinimicrobium marinum]|uniref:Ig-like domain-containing protein n=1 Tax=Salinimicrobium marinum TaxID=680283 RepID=A0A918VVQ8_9FLAO|nr:PKD-like domain-containing protein [Salinimicrobium marinum]GHA27418.1 hypothetical protein GCM10007103_06000 [Salinimicrobium marinum]
MRKKTTSILLVSFLLVLTSALASYWKAPAKGAVLFPTTIDQQQLSWNESPFGVFALGYDDCENDTQDPTVLVKNIIISLNSAGTATIDADDVDNGSSDNCGITDRNLSQSTFGCSDVGQQLVRLTISDAKGNSAYKDAIVTVEDNIDPEVITRDLSVQLDEYGNASISKEQIDNGSNDACGIKSTSLDITRFDCNDIGLNTVTLTVTDENGKIASKTATVTVEDNMAPTVVTKNITVQLDASGNATIAEDAVNNGSSDSCGGLTFDTNITSFDCDDVGTNTVTLTVTDKNGKSDNKTAIVTVEDNVTPTVVTKNITVQLDASGNATIAEDAVNSGSSDSCGGLTFDTNITSFDCDDVGTNTVTLTVTDKNGKSDNKTAIVTVEDNVAPTIVTKNITVQLDASGNATIAEDAVNSGSSDSCGGLTFDTNITSFDCNDVGINTVTLTVEDKNGKSDSKTAIVTVEDKVAPILPTIEELDNWSCGKEIPVPIANDNCAGEVTGTTSDATTFSSPGEYFVTWTFNDGNENSITAEAQKIVIPEPTVEIPEIDGSAFCNTEEIPAIVFTGNTLENKSYSWSYESSTGNTIDIGIPSSGIGNIPAFSAKNISNEPVTALFTVIPFGNDCQGQPGQFSIIVNPTPTITKPADMVVCHGEVVPEIIFSGASVNGSDISWTNDNPAIGLLGSGTNKLPSFTAVNNSTESIFGNITITPSANGCIGIPETFKIEVKPNPTVNAPADIVYCNGVTTTSITLSGSPTGVKYDILGGGSIGLSNKMSVPEIPSFIPVNNSTVPVAATITIIPKANGCTGDPVTYDVTVNPTPNVSISPSNQQLCSGETTSLSLSGGIEGSVFNWTVSEISPAGSIEGAADGNGSEIAQTLTNNTNSPATVKYRVVPSAKDCEGTPITVTVTVNPTPVLHITDPETVCSPAVVDLTSEEITQGSSSGLSLSYWTNEGATRPVANPNDVGPGTYFIKATTSSSCSIIKPVVVTENPTPELTSPLQASGFCSETPFVYEFSSNIPGTTYSWDRQAIDGISTPANRGEGNIGEVLVNDTNNPIKVTYEITLVSQDGCPNIQEISTTVTPTPTLTSTLSPPAVCSETPFEYTPLSKTSGTVFKWTRAAVEGIRNSAAGGTGSINETLENTTNQPLTVTYIYSLSSNNCTNPDTYNLTVTVIPAPETEVLVSKRGEQPVKNEIEVCPGESVDLFSSTSFVENLPPVLLTSDFNNGIQNWTTQSSSNNTNWSLTNSGTRAYGGTYCYYRFENWRWRLICEDREVNFHSNDNSQFFLISSYENNRDYSNVSLISPSFSTKGYTSLELSFWHHYKDGGGYRNNQEDIGRLQYSINNGDWLNLETYTSTQGEEDRFEKETIYNLPVGQEDVRIRFNYDNAYNDRYWAVDNIRITGEGSGSPEVEWTSDIGDFTSTEPNPKDVTPVETTVYTATYMDPVTQCPGRASVKVIVRKPPEVTISANYCGDSRYIELTSDNEFASYYWESAGKEFGRGRTLNVEVAQTYILTVTDEYGCTGTGSINISEELVANGDFEAGARDFQTDYRNKTGTGDLYPEGDYAVDDDAHDYHSNFYGRDHTTGNGNFLIVNGSPRQNQVIWKQTIDDIQPNTNYYFSAWGMNVNPASPAQLQFRVNGELTGTVAYLDNADKPTSNNQVSRENWIQFYSNPFWNSEENTSVTLEIVNINVTLGGNDFGLDDISFGTLEPIIFSIDPSNNSTICSGDTLELYSNIEGGREPIEFTWTNSDGEVVSTEENPVLENISAEDAGTYTLSVTDAYGCDPTVGTTEVFIIPETIVDAGEDLIICAEEAEIQLNGEISGSVSSGFWSGGNGNFNPNSGTLNAIYTPTADEIITGRLTLTLTSNAPDEPCEPVLDSVSIQINPTPVIDRIEVNSPLCFSGSDGSAKVIVSGGTPPFTYSWSNGQTKETATGLSETEETENLFVIVSDANGCSVTSDNIIIEEPTALEITSVEYTETTCFGNADGTATIVLSGGNLAGNTPLYNYQLLNSEGSVIFSEENSEENSFTASGLVAGNFTFLVSTGESCSALTRNVTITQPAEVIADAGIITPPNECGTKVVALEAVQVDPEIGSGEWSFTSSNGGTGNFTNLTSNATTFYGEAGKNYELTWTVTPIIDCPPVVSEPVAVGFPAECSKLNFDGEDDHISFGDNHNLNIQNSFTIEAWVKPHTLVGINTIISKRNSNNLSEGGYDLILNTGRPALRINNTTISVTQRLTFSRWYHIAATHNGSEVNIYIDGLKVKTQSLNETPGEIAAPTLIGAMHNASTQNVPENYFHGWMEEVRIWKKALSEDQLHFIMNQRVEKEGSSGIVGEVLPVSIPGNLVWSDLVGYYRLLSSEVTDGTTTDLSFNGIDGELKNIEDNQENTAPLPYILYTTNNGNWYDNSTWQLPAEINGRSISQRNVWEAPNSTGIDQRTKINWNIVKLPQNVKNPGSPTNMNSITLLGLISEAGTLEMMGMNNVQGNALTITSYLKLDGIIDLNGESQLIQPEGSKIEQSPNLDISKTGYIEQDQQGTSSSFNYNYWSSPVIPSASASTFKVAEIMYDGAADGARAWKTINFGNGPFYADGPLTSPIKISNYWINAFRNKKANDYSSWEHVGSEHELLAGEGYTMKGPENISVADAAARKIQQNYTFKGFPNNGDVQLQVGKGQQYLIGNPYPSAINIEEFIKENTKDGAGRNSVNVFNGAIYFWDHFSGKTHYLEEYIGGYATRNRLDGVPAASTDKRINANNAKGTKRPGAYISVGQGFFINTTLDSDISNFTSVEGGTLTFKNNQRAFAPESPGASMFLMPEIREKSSVKEDTRSKIRLNFSSPNGYHRQILVGVDKDASNDFDLGFDALSMNHNKEDMFWLIREHQFVIQGVSNFDRDQVLPLSIKTEVEGEFTIEIAELLNVPEETEIYLRDNQDTTYHNLRDEEFKLAIEPGTFNDRFEIVFTDGKVIEDNRSKIWLNFESSNGHTRKLRVIADEESTDKFDAGKEEILSENLSEDMYWLIEESKFLTQEVPGFDEDRELPLGIKVADDGTFSINISRLSNIPDDKEIYLKDSKNKLFHNLRKSAYQSTAVPGSVNDRFALVFKETISKDEDILPAGLEIIYVHDTREILIRNPQLLDISRINLSNLLGQQVHVFYNVPLQQEISLPVARFSSGVYIVRLQSSEGSVSKKVILE